MKRQKGGRLRDRDGRALSSYARRGKVPFRYDMGESQRAIQPASSEQNWRKPRSAKPYRTAPRGR